MPQPHGSFWGFAGVGGERSSQEGGGGGRKQSTQKASHGNASSQNWKKIFEKEFIEKRFPPRTTALHCIVCCGAIPCSSSRGRRPLHLPGIPHFCVQQGIGVWSDISFFDILCLCVCNCVQCVGMAS